MNSEKKQTKKTLLLSILFGVIFFLGAAIATVSTWYAKNFDIEFKELLYTLASPLKGTGNGTMWLIVKSCVPPVLALMAGYVLFVYFFCFRHRSYVWCRRVGAVFCVVLLLGSLFNAYHALRIPAYLELRKEQTTIYEDYYVSPDKVAITADGEKKNLIYIYLESMETTYASVEDGGAQTVNYMPFLTELAREGVSFSDGDGLGGFHSISGTGWTMGALLGTTSGVPFSLSVSGEQSHNSMGNRKNFAKGLVTLGDILEREGYRQMFLCGSDADFAGRRNYFEQHGNFEIFDLDSAIEAGDVDGANDWWGVDDLTLYEIAKRELTELASSSDTPFHFSMLTVDTHHVGGYVCDACSNDYANKTANVVSCADSQLYVFVEWCKQQPFYENSVLVITGDHPRMDTSLVGGVDFYDRTVYNCFLNTDTEVLGSDTERIWTSLDMFPTTLAALGFSIEGDRLGLGTNLFSDKPTLAEELGYDVLEQEVSKYSEYYIKHFS